ncbi:MAG: SusC/RagA family TonB-linked outer membrane protein [Ginsengibacter sp.]
MKILLLLLFCCAGLAFSPTVWAQHKTIQGTVLDEETGQPLSNISVMVKKTKIGTTTDNSGHFELQVDANMNPVVLVLSSIGFAQKEITIGPTMASIKAIRLAKAIRAGDEVVVVGYGTQEKRKLTGSVGIYKPTKELGALPLTIDNAMVGKIAGVYVAPSSGVPGSATAITIRGISTLNTNGNAPLIVVDGVPIYGIDRNKNTTDFGIGNVQSFAFGGTGVVGNYMSTNTFEKNPLSTINPDDIESIEVLKDAYSTAIYGSRGAAGVILITTKKGKIGKMCADAQLSTSVNSPFKLPKLMNGDQYADFYTNYFHALDSVNAIDNPYYWPNNYVFSKGTNTDWLKEVARNGVGLNASVAISGGNDKGSYYISSGYNKDESYIINNDFTRYEGRVRLDQHLSKKFTVGTDISLNYAKNNSLNAQSIYRDAILKSPNLKVKNPDGTYNWGFDGNSTGPESDVNPLGTALTGANYSIDSRVIGNVFAEYKLLPWLLARSEFGMDWLTSNSYSRQINKPYTNGGVGNETVSLDRKWVINNTLTINKSFSTKHSIDGVIGQSFESSIENTSSIYGRGFLNDQILSISAASKRGLSSALGQQWALASYFGRMNYAFERKYLLGVTYRLDGSSKFAANHRYVGFPSFSLGWIANQESFLKNIKAIDQLKFRGSIGFTGSDGGGGYYGNQGQYELTTYSPNYGDLGEISVSQPNNPNLKWERTKTFDVGMDLSLWRSRLNITVDYYRKQINNAILPSGIPAYMGFSTQVQNLADLNNHGLELTVNSVNINSEDFQWTTNLNISRSRNIIEKLHKVDPTNLAAQIELNGGRFWLQGYSATQFFLYNWGGVDPANGNPVWVDKSGNKIETPFSQTTPYSDKSGYYAQRMAQGDALPKFFGGFGNTFTWKGVALDAFFSFSYGNKIFNGSKAALYNYGQSSLFNAQVNNLSPDLLNYWKTPGQNTDIPALINASNYYAAGYGSTFDYTLGRDISRFLEDASFIKLRTLTLAYDFNKATLGNLRYINSLKVFAESDNVFIITKYSGIDPEVSAYGSSSLNAGYDELTMPAARTYRIGIKLGL